MEFNADLPALPKGWVWTRVGEIADNIENVNPKTNPDREFLYIDIASIDNKLQKITKPKKYYGKNAPSRARQLIISGDILFSTVRTYLKNIAVVNDIYDGNIASTGFCVIRALPQIHHRYIFWFVQTDFFLNPLNQLQRGTSYPAVRDSDIFSQVILLPPLPEQHRIVNKIEELFTKLDAGVDALKKIKIQLKRYRQAVLKNAFEGKLTQHWREAHKGEFEPASVLLEKIKEQRKKESKGKFIELPPIDTSELPELPEGWVWTTISQLVAPSKNSIKRGPFGSSIKKEFFTKNGFKVYEQQNAIYDNHKLGNYYISQDKFDELKDFEVKPGDFIISCSGTIGKIALIPEKAERGIINQALLKLTIDRSLVIPIFFLEYFRFEKFQKKLLKETRGSAIKNINSVKEIKSIPFPLPPLPEQHQIVAEIERRLSLADQLKKVVEQSLKQAERLHQSILKHAFEGKLVHQDPTDEPAEKLLERIKEEKESRGLIKQKSGKGK
jgi:type I restriction enzyme S subunit